MKPEFFAAGLDCIGATEGFVRYARSRHLVTVLCMHRVSPDVDSLYPPLAPELFRDLCRYLKQRYHVICFRDVAHAAQFRPSKPLLILSFDDGYKDFLEYAVPILLEEGLRANQNVITSCADTGRTYTWQACIDLFAGVMDADLEYVLERLGAGGLWKGQDRARLALDFTRWFQELAAHETEEIAERLADINVKGVRMESSMMRWDDIRAMDRLGFEVGSHTVSHPSLDKLSPVQLDTEVRESKKRIEEQVGHPINVISVPNGRFDRAVVEKVLEVGYRHVLTTEEGLNETRRGLWRRIPVYGTTRHRVRVRATGLEGAVRRAVGRGTRSAVSFPAQRCPTDVVADPEPVWSAPSERGLVSVVVPMFNASEFVGEAVRSVIQQTYRRWELVVVDDGSTDDSKRVVSRYLDDPRIRYVQQDNSGVAVARNRGFCASHGEFVAFLDADDLWLPDNLEVKVDYLRRNADVAVVHDDVESIDASGERMNRRYTSREGFVLENLLLWDGTVITGPSSCLIRRTALNLVGGFDARLSTAADQDLCIRLATRFKFGRIRKTTTLYRVHVGNMHRDISRMERDHLEVYRKAEANGFFRSRWFRQRCYSNVYMILGASWWKDGGNRRRACYFFLKALVAFPANAVELLRGFRKRRETRNLIAQWVARHARSWRYM